MNIGLAVIGVFHFFLHLVAQLPQCSLIIRRVVLAEGLKEVLSGLVFLLHAQRGDIGQRDKHAGLVRFGIDPGVFARFLQVLLLFLLHFFLHALYVGIALRVFPGLRVHAAHFLSELQDVLARLRADAGDILGGQGCVVRIQGGVVISKRGLVRDNVISKWGFVRIIVIIRRCFAIQKVLQGLLADDLNGLAGLLLLDGGLDL